MKLHWKRENEISLRLRVNLTGGWYICAVTNEYHRIPTETDRVNVAIYNESGELGAEGIAYCDFPSLQEADACLWELLLAGEGPKAIVKFLTNRDLLDSTEVLSLARSLIRDTCFGWSGSDLAADPESVCDKITQLLGDNYNFVKGE